MPPATRAILAELERHPSLALVANPKTAAVLAQFMGPDNAKPKTMPQLTEAIGDAAGKVGLNEGAGEMMTPLQVAEVLRTYCKARRRADPDEAPARPNRRPRVEAQAPPLPRRGDR